MKTYKHEKEPQKINNIHHGFFALKLIGPAKSK